MKPRCQLTQAEVTAIRKELCHNLRRMGVPSRPEVAARVLKLIADPDASLVELARTVGSDAALAGRVLRLANSAIFGQRTPVASLERAAVLLGAERLKVIALGFSLATAAGKREEFSRRLWGQSLFRACLAQGLARQVLPGRTAEAFVVGLMLDAGLPVLVSWLGAPAERIVREEAFPAAQYQREEQELPFTHVDVVSAMLTLWGFPDVLADPVVHHHCVPAGPPENEQAWMRSVAWCVGSLRLDIEPTSGNVPMPEGGPDPAMLGLSSAQLVQAIRLAADEYRVLLEMFRTVAEVLDPWMLIHSAHVQLVDVVDQTMLAGLVPDSRRGPVAMVLAGRRIEIEPAGEGQATAYLSDANGRRLISHTFDPAREAPRVVLESLGIDPELPHAQDELRRCLQHLGLAA